MAKRSTKKQVSLFRERDEAQTLLRAVEQIQSVKVSVKEYKKGSYGVKIKDTCITDQLPLTEAENMCDHLNNALQSYSVCLAEMAQEYVSKIVLNLRGVEKKAPAATVDPTDTKVDQ